MSELADLIRAQLLHEYEMRLDMMWHEAIHGVPVGPTLNMVHPPVIRGIGDPRLERLRVPLEQRPGGWVG